MWYKVGGKFKELLNDEGAMEMVDLVVVNESVELYVCSLHVKYDKGDELSRDKVDVIYERHSRINLPYPRESHPHSRKSMYGTCSRCGQLGHNKKTCNLNHTLTPTQPQHATQSQPQTVASSETTPQEPKPILVTRLFKDNNFKLEV